MLTPSVNGNTQRFVDGLANFDLLYYTYYHRTVGSTGAQAAPLVFFQAVNGANLLTTNMNGGQIPKDNAFLVQHINCNIVTSNEASLVSDAEFAKVVKDLHLLLSKSVVFLGLGPTEYLTVPTWQLPAGGGMAGATGAASAAGTSVGFVTNGAPVHQNAYPIRLP